MELTNPTVRDESEHPLLMYGWNRTRDHDENDCDCIVKTYFVTS